MATVLKGRLMKCSNDSCPIMNVHCAFYGLLNNMTDTKLRVNRVINEAIVKENGDLFMAIFTGQKSHYPPANHHAIHL